MAASRPKLVTTIVQRLPKYYFDDAKESYEQATANAGCADVFYLEIASIKIALHAAGNELLPRISATLAHLEIPPPMSVDFTVCCWDGASTGSDMPLPTQEMLWTVRHNCVGTLSNDRFRTFYIEWMDIISCVDLEGKIAYCCYSDVKSLLMYEISGPLRPIFNTILNQKGMQLIHAAAIGNSSGSLLFAGPPGAGKSTLAVLCLREGLSYQSDDLCVISSDPNPRSFCLYNIAKLREDSFPRFKAYEPILEYFEETEKKAFFYVHHHFPGQILKDASIRALILPRVNHNTASRLERVLPVEAVHAVVSHTIREVPKYDNAGEKIMIRAVSKLPAYRLLLGPDEQETVTIIKKLLS
jgi:hypothetical protein